MAIIIKNRFNVLKYKPLVPTYAIRIVSCGDRKELTPLIDSPLFRKINVYPINDTTFDLQGNGPVPEGVGKKLILDFIDATAKFKDIQDILIHCNEGKARSPGVGGALNEIFNLGYPIWRIETDFPGVNKDVYNQIVSIAKRMGIASPQDRNIFLERYSNAE